MKIVIKTLYLLGVLLAGIAQTCAQSGDQKLTATILHLDSAFWNAYNNCDTAHFKDFITNDVEFYHDKGGITSGAKALIESLDKNICGAPYKVRREAVAASVKVYPMRNGNEIYGAIISGEHLFFMTEQGKPERQTGVANFTQLWILKDGIWKMNFILSYNHHEPEYVNARKEIALTSQQLDQFRGNYKSDRSGTMSVTRNNNVLLLKGGNNTFTLYPLSATSFFTKERDLVFEFVKDAAGKPLKLIVKEGGALADELMFVK